MKIIIILLLCMNLIAQDDYSMRVGYGTASDKNLGDIVVGDLSSSKKDLSVVVLDGGYLLKKDLFDLPLDLYAKGGFSYFNEDTHSDVYEAIVYIKVIYNIDFWDNRVRVGFGEGISYARDVPEVEYDEAIVDNDETSKLLNYLDISIDFDIGRLVGYKPLRDTYIGYLLKHRSGVFGLYNGVHGGSNYNTIYLEKNF